MRLVLQWTVAAAWGLWLGATAAMFVFAPYLFHRFGTQSEIARGAVHALFIVFGRYELVLAAIAIVAAGMLLINFGNKWTPLLVLALIFAGGMAITTTLGFTPLMESLRAQGKVGSAAFERLHTKSMIAMSLQLVMLLGTGGLLVATLSRRDARRSAPPRTTAEAGAG